MRPLPARATTAAAWRGSLSVGLTAAVGPGVLDGALTALRRAAPALSIALREIRPREIVPMLPDRRLDLVLARSTPREPGIDVIELPPTPAALVVPLGHRLAGADRVELAAIDGERLLTWSPPGSPYTDLLLERCRRAGASVTPVESAVTGGTGLVELAALDSVALVPAPSPPVAGTLACESGNEPAVDHGPARPFDPFIRYG
jgi:DNA-binding transcriptional LysR family regulator